jgi:hypothetical protein
MSGIHLRCWLTGRLHARHFSAPMPLLAIPFPAIDPVIFEIGPIAVRWYALAYIAGILFAVWYAKRLVSTPHLWGPASRRQDGPDR